MNNINRVGEVCLDGHGQKLLLVLVIFAERLSSAMNTLGAEHAARSMIRDKRVHSL
jgi:hypothetical protein